MSYDTSGSKYWTVDRVSYVRDEGILLKVELVVVVAVVDAVDVRVVENVEVEVWELEELVVEVVGVVWDDFPDVRAT